MTAAASAAVEGDLAVIDVCRRVRREIEGGHDPEVAAAAANRPEQFGVLRGARVHDLAAGRDHLRGGHVVQGQAVLPDLPADAAGQGQPADTDALGVTGGDRQARRGQGRRDLAPGGAAADPHQVAFGVEDLHVREPAEVDHDTAVVGAEAREAMAAAPHGQRQPGASPKPGREPDPGLYVLDAPGPQDITRIAHSQGRAASRLVRGSARFDDGAAEVTAKGFQC
jgi:hypothetical protein